VSGNSGSLQASAGQSLVVGAITTVAGDVRLDAVKDIILGELNVEGKLDVSTITGNINQTGPLNAAGTSDLRAPAGKIDLGNTANKFGGQVSFKSPNTVFAGSGAPSNGLEQAIVASVLAQTAQGASMLPSLQNIVLSLTPLATQSTIPVAPTDTAGPSTSTETTPGATVGGPVAQTPGTLGLTVGGFQVVEVSSAQLALLQPVPAPSAGRTADASISLDTATVESKGSKSQDDAAVSLMVRSTPDTLGRVSLFVIDGGIRLPQGAQDGRASSSSSANTPEFRLPQDRKDRLQPQDE
jgi:hypothetical protein